MGGWVKILECEEIQNEARGAGGGWVEDSEDET